MDGASGSLKVIQLLVPPLWRWLHRPKYIRRRHEEWSEEERALLERKGVARDGTNAKWVSEASVKMEGGSFHAVRVGWRALRDVRTLDSEERDLYLFVSKSDQ